MRMAGSTRAQHTIDELLDRACAQAVRGPARDQNPRVGCVLVGPEGEVLAEAHHAGAGSPHAEAAALAAAGDRARGATAYVTLEPCAHQGRTGPCASALHQAGVSRVVYAVDDPTRQASGGAQWLRAQGVQVVQHRHQRCEELVADWARAARLGRPHVTWKIASSLDGRVAAADGSSRWISSPASRADAHLLRAGVHAIVVGTGTALSDDPALTARRPDGTELPTQPLRVVVGERALPAGSRLSTGTGTGTGPALQLRSHDPVQVLAELADQGVHTVLLEGGPTLAGAFWRAGCVDELLVYLAPTLLGAGAPAVPDLGIGTITDQARLDLLEVTQVGPDLRLRLVPASHPNPAPGTDASRPNPAPYPDTSPPNPASHPDPPHAAPAHTSQED